MKPSISIYQVEVTSLWPQTAVAESETHNIYVWWWTDMSMKWVGCPNHILTHMQVTSDKPQTIKTKRISYCHCHCHIDYETQRISGLDCKHMTIGYNRNWWNTLYIHKVDLLWVWSGWGVSIITCSILQVRTQVNVLLLLPLLLQVHIYIRLELELHPYDHWPQLKVLKHCINI